MLQRPAYNGHKRKLALQCQAITAPDGIFIQLYRPEVGRRLDMFIYVASRMEELLLTLMMMHGKQFAVLADSRYSWCVYLEVPYGGASLHDVRSAFNRKMSKVRISVECYFMEVKRFWILIDANRKLRIAQMHPGLIYRAPELLTNCYSCTSKNSISQYFSVQLPVMKE